MNKLGFIGAGTVATTLAFALNQKGYMVVAVSSRSQQSADRLARLIDGCCSCSNNHEVADRSDFVFITTPDDVIASVVADTKWRQGQSIIHCSGADSTDILAQAIEAGAAVGAFHPLQTFASIKRDNPAGITYALEAEEPLLTALKEMATALGGRWIVLKAEDKVLYHTAAVFACNYLVTLVKIATDLWQSFNIPPQQATRALLPLLHGTINSIDDTGIPHCLTGPVARGDSGTIKKHLKALQEVAPELVVTYRELGLKTIPIALAKGKINNEQADELKITLGQPLERMFK